MMQREKFPTKEEVAARLAEDVRIVIDGLFSMEVRPARKGPVNGLWKGSMPRNRHRIRITPSRTLTRLLNEIIDKRKD